MNSDTQVLCHGNTFQGDVVYGVGANNWFASIGNADDFALVWVKIL